MSEELYRPLPDPDAYLERIGVSGAKPPSADFLDELIFAHQRHVPFENLDVCEKKLNPSLAIADLHDKIVVRKRGGYCFELNAAFAALLRSLGFAVRPCMARVLLRPAPHPLISHRANFVDVAGKTYLADVGFGGPMPAFAPLVAEGASRTELGHAFALHRNGHAWWDVGYTGSSEAERIVLSVCTLRVGEEDFVPLSFYQAQNPTSVFRLNRMANIKTADGAFDLRNTTFTEFRGGEKTAREIDDEQEVTRLLAERFGIVR